MKHAKKLLCAILSLAMALSLAVVPAFADGDGDAGETGGTEPEEETAEWAPITALPVTEYIAVKDGSAKLDDSSTFMPTYFEVTMAPAAAATDSNDVSVKGGVDFTNKNNNNGVVAVSTDEKKEASASIADGASTYTFCLSTGNQEESWAFDLTDITFTQTGEYRYTITTQPVLSDEQAEVGTYTLNHLVNKDKATTVYVNLSVIEKDGAYVVAQVRVWSQDVLDGTQYKIYKDDGITKSIADAVPFKDPLDVVELKIANHVYGDLADSTKDFTFYINIPEGGDSVVLKRDETFTYTYYQKQADGTVAPVTTDEDGNELTLKISGDKENMLTEKNNTITLKDGEYIIVHDLPEGMIIGVIEEDETDDGYVTDHSWMATYEETLASGQDVTFSTGSGGDNTAITGDHDTDAAEGASIICASETGDNHNYIHKSTLGVSGNEIHFYNGTDAISNTGITMDILPYVIVVAAAASLAVLSISKKRRADR
jgi:hypothetical protein